MQKRPVISSILPTEATQDGALGAFFGRIQQHSPTFVVGAVSLHTHTLKHPESTNVLRTTIPSLCGVYTSLCDVNWSVCCVHRSLCGVCIFTYHNAVLTKQLDIPRADLRKGQPHKALYSPTNKRQYTATHGKTLQQTAIHCNTRQDTV